MLDNSPIRMPADGRAPSSAEALRHWAEHAPDKIAFRLLSGEDIAHEINYGALYKRAENVAGALSQKANPGDRVMLLFAQGLDFVVGFVACQMAGMIPVPMSLPRGRERNSRLAHVEADCLPAVILSHEAARKALAGRTFSVPVIEISKMENGTPQASTRNNDIAFLQYTSGSTGTPKGVIISQDNLWSNVADISASFRVKQQSETVTWLPSYHDMGLVGTILVPLFQGVTSNLMAPDDFIRRPLSWLNAISRFRADIAGGPNFALELCANRLQNTEQAPWVGDLDLSTWQVLFVGAEPVNAETLARFSAAAAPYGFNPASFLPCYGLAEATLYAAGSRGTPGQLTQRFDTSALQNGRAVPANDSPRNKKADTPRLPPTSLVGCGGKNLQRSTQVVIADPDTRTPLNDRLLGEVWLSGPGISKGYWPNSQDDGKFQARIEGMPETAFLRTGDIGFIDDGNLYITGRISDLIIVNGVNYFPPDLENSTAAADDRLPKWRAAAFSYAVNGHPKVVAIQEIPRLGRHDLKMSELVSRIRQSVFDDHGLTLDDVVLLKPGGIPVTASGKVQRRRCRDLYLARELENLASPSGSGAPLPEKAPGDEDAMIGQTPVTEALRTALASVLNLTLADIDISKRMNEFPLDSLRIVEVQAFLESRHGMIISAEALQSETPLNLISSSRGNSPAADPAVYWRDAALDTVLSSECPTETCDAVLITGATGLVGSNLVASITRLSDGPIYCLVRDGDGAPGADRLKRQLSDAGVEDTVINQRIFPISGDIAHPMFGLEQDEYDRLSKIVGTIYHNAAELDFLRPYEKLRPINVDGTRHILKFAMTGTRKKVAHVSSVSVLETPVRSGRLLDEKTILDYPETLATGYAQSKWVADLLVSRAKDMGLDARIFRPPWILGTMTGVTESSGFISRFLKTCLMLGAIPDSRFGWNIVTPTFVADAIAHSMQPSAPEAAVYHLGMATPVNHQVFQAAFADTGTDVDVLPAGKWKKLLKRAMLDGRKTPLQPLASLFFQDTDGANAADIYIEGTLPVMDSSHTQAVLAELGVFENAPDIAGFIRQSVLEPAAE